MKVTAETITPTQIDWVYVSALGLARGHREADPDLMHACTVAHNTHSDFTNAEQAAAKSTVADAWNTRHGAKP